MKIMESVLAGDDVGVRVRADHGVYMRFGVSDSTRIHEGLRIRPIPIRGRIVHVRPVGSIEACSLCSLLGSASVTPELGSFLVDGSPPPGQEEGGLVRRVYLCQVGRCEGPRDGGARSWWVVMFRAALDQEQQSNITWVGVDKIGIPWATHANRKPAWVGVDKIGIPWATHANRKPAWAVHDKNF
jgi:hypothetical protein